MLFLDKIMHFAWHISWTRLWMLFALCFLGLELDSASIAPQAKLLHFRLGHEIATLLLR